MKTLQASLVIEGRQHQVLVSYTENKIVSVLNRRDEVLNTLTSDQVKSLEKEIAWTELKYSLSREGIPTKEYAELQ